MAGINPLLQQIALGATLLGLLSATPVVELCDPAWAEDSKILKKSPEKSLKTRSATKSVSPTAKTSSGTAKNTTAKTKISNPSLRRVPATKSDPAKSIADRPAGKAATTNPVQKKKPVGSALRRTKPEQQPAANEKGKAGISPSARSDKTKPSQLPRSTAIAPRSKTGKAETRINRKAIGGTASTRPKDRVPGTMIRKPADTRNTAKTRPAGGLGTDKRPRLKAGGGDTPAPARRATLPNKRAAGKDTAAKPSPAPARAQLNTARRKRATLKSPGQGDGQGDDKGDGQQTSPQSPRDRAAAKLRVESFAERVGASPAAKAAAEKKVAAGGKGAEDDAKLDLIADAQGLPRDEVRNSGMKPGDVLQLITEVTALGSTPDDYQKPGFWDKVRKDGRDAVVKDAVVDGLGLPEDAKDAGDAEDLIDIVADAQQLGDDERHTSKEFWEKVKKQGRDAALKDIAIENLGLPPEAANAGKTKDVLDGAADGEMIGADISGAGYWKDYAKYKNGTMPRDDFINKHAGGAARDAAQDAAGGGGGTQPGQGTGAADAAGQAQVDAARQAAVQQDAAMGTGTGTGGATGSGASGASSGQQSASGGSSGTGFGAGAPGSGGTGVGSDADGSGFGMGESQDGQPGERSGSFVVVHHNDDGSVTMTHFTVLDDGSGYSHDQETYVLNEDGLWVNERGEVYNGLAGNDGPPEDGAYGTEYGDDGSYTVYDNEKKDEQSASADSGSDDGSGDDDDGDDDDDSSSNGGDDGSDSASSSDGGSEDEDSGDDAAESDESTPNPMNDGGDPSAGLRWAMANPDNPLARQILKDTERQIANRRGGGVTDPAGGDYESGKGLLWAMMNPNNPVARQILKDAGKAMDNSGRGQVGGPDNNPENDGRTGAITANDLKALEIILAGGGAADPPETDSGSTPGSAPPNPVTGAPPPIVGGSAAQNAAEAASTVLQNGNFEEKLKTSVGQ